MATEHNQMGEQVIAILKDAETGEVKQVEKTVDPEREAFKDYWERSISWLARFKKTEINS